MPTALWPAETTGMCFSGIGSILQSSMVKNSPLKSLTPVVQRSCMTRTYSSE